MIRQSETQGAAAVRSYLLHPSLAGAQLFNTFYRPHLLHQGSVSYVTLEIFNEVHQSNPVNPLETLKKSTGFRALEESNNRSPIIFFHCSLFVIG